MLVLIDGYATAVHSTEFYAKINSKNRIKLMGKHRDPSRVPADSIGGKLSPKPPSFTLYVSPPAATVLLWMYADLRKRNHRDKVGPWSAYGTLNLPLKCSESIFLQLQGDMLELTRYTATELTCWQNKIPIVLVLHTTASPVSLMHRGQWTTPVSRRRSQDKNLRLVIYYFAQHDSLVILFRRACIYKRWQYAATH